MTQTVSAFCGTGLFGSRPLRRAPASWHSIPAYALAMAMLILGVSPRVAAGQGNGSTAPASVTLNPGDAIRITVWRKPELSGEFSIAPNGTIVHPLYKDVQVAGIPISAIEARLLDVISKIEKTPFVFEPLLRVSVEGEVRTPSVYTLRPETTVAQAIAIAGGTTERARTDRVRVVRSDGEVSVDLRRSGVGGMGMAIRSGDRIAIDRDRAVFRDFVSPVITILGATAAVVSVILYQGHR